MRLFYVPQRLLWPVQQDVLQGAAVEGACARFRAVTACCKLSTIKDRMCQDQAKTRDCIWPSQPD